MRRESVPLATVPLRGLRLSGHRTPAKHGALNALTALNVFPHADDEIEERRPFKDMFERLSALAAFSLRSRQGRKL
jgi:hypothetical protein